MGNLELARQPCRKQPAGDCRNRRSREHDEPAERLTVDDEIHADAQHHAAHEAADDGGRDAKSEDVGAGDHAAATFEC